MEQRNKYEVVAVAYKSRFVFRTEADYRRALGASFETIVGKRDSARDMEVYYGILARRADEEMDRPLDDIIDDYLIASRLYLTLDWGDRTQIVSRRKFCRMLFRLAATAGRPLSSDEMFRFKTKEADGGLLELFFPDGKEEAPMVIICFIVLFAFGVIRPWSGDNSRGRDFRDKETLDALKKLADLISLLKEDTPRLGSTEKPLAFDQWGEMLAGYLRGEDDLGDCTPLMMLRVVTDIARACRSLVVSEEQRLEGERLQGLYMHGIWIDDADAGRTRFWVFPDNLLAAFCYRRNGVGWELDSYELRVRLSMHASYSDSFMLMTPRGNLNYTLSPERILDGAQMATGSCDPERDEASGEITRVELGEESLRFPQWLDWRTWEQLAPDDARYKEFRGALTAVYDPQSPHSVIFRNSAPELSDNVNNLVGRDNRYLYVYDWRPGRFLIRERQPGVFVYEGNTPHYETERGLFELDITEEHPLYVIPVDMAGRKFGNPELDRLAAIMTDAANITEAYIIHSAQIPFPRLTFPTYGSSIGLDMELLAAAGIRKFTRRPF
ncbi:MAG: hypothetical protein HDR87_10175 [Bacteroides sp.]|nr:hypothetical protein [Bacteroides sp.]